MKKVLFLLTLGCLFSCEKWNDCDTGNVRIKNNGNEPIYVDVTAPNKVSNSEQYLLPSQAVVYTMTAGDRVIINVATEAEHLDSHYNLFYVKITACKTYPYIWSKNN